MVRTLFPLNDYLPAHVVNRKRTGPAKGTRPVNAKFDEPTKVARIPVSWTPDEIKERFELLQSALYTVEAELVAAKRRGKGTLSNRFEHLAALVSDLRDILPRGDTYDPFRGDTPCE
jgi:hypothetical protein